MKTTKSKIEIMREKIAKETLSMPKEILAMITANDDVDEEIKDAEEYLFDLGYTKSQIEKIKNCGK